MAIFSQRPTTLRILSNLSKVGEMSSRQLASSLHLGGPTVGRSLKILIHNGEIESREIGGETLFSLTNKDGLTPGAKKRLALQERVNFPLPAWIPGKDMLDLLEGMR